MITRNLFRNLLTKKYNLTSRVFRPFSSEKSSDESEYSSLTESDISNQETSTSDIDSLSESSDISSSFSESDDQYFENESKWTFSVR